MFVRNNGDETCPDDDQAPWSRSLGSLDIDYHRLDTEGEFNKWHHRVFGGYWRDVVGVSGSGSNNPSYKNCQGLFAYASDWEDYIHYNNCEGSLAKVL